MGIVELQNVRKVYPLGKLQVEAVKGVSFCIEKGDFISIAGSVGLRQDDHPQHDRTASTSRPPATVLLDGQADVKPQGRGADPPPARDPRLHIPVVQPDSRPQRSGRTSSSPCCSGKTRVGKAARRRNGSTTSSTRSASCDWRKHKPNELSGGQRQRVAMARALVTRPQIVLADEPTANLDSATGEQILDLMKKINRELETTFIFSTHDARIVDTADHIIRLRDGLGHREQAA
ncbi:MAG: ABC transporter ATP-binding protein [Desulfobacterales bacterium]|nr:ABC transporter ATP-binding protein [Desulfobacterales bacterium]